jgi:hypothetical protein
MIGVGRHLHRQLAAGGERRGETAEQLVVAGYPLDGGVREDQVVFARRLEGGEITFGEA